MSRGSEFRRPLAPRRSLVVSGSRQARQAGSVDSVVAELSSGLDQSSARLHAGLKILVVDGERSKYVLHVFLMTTTVDLQAGAFGHSHFRVQGARLEDSPRCRLPHGTRSPTADRGAAAFFKLHGVHGFPQKLQSPSSVRRNARAAVAD